MPTGTYFADWVAPAAQAAFDADYGEVKVRPRSTLICSGWPCGAISKAGIGEAQAALVAMRPTAG